MQKKLIYLQLTDLHLNYLSEENLSDFYKQLNTFDGEGLFITGDTSTGSQLIYHIERLAQEVRKNIYFVLGNHDYYHSSFKETEKNIARLTEKYSNLRYLTKEKVTPISPKTALIGHAGWYDARWRDPWTSMVFIIDWYYIKDFRILYTFGDCLALARERADKSAKIIEKRLLEALSKFDTVYLLTHFPPWPDKSSTLWRKITKDFWMPYNSSKVMAEMLEKVMKNYPEKKLIILAGHTHKKRDEQIAPNVILRVGQASFGKVYLDDIYEID